MGDEDSVIDPSFGSDEISVEFPLLSRPFANLGKYHLIKMMM